MSIENEIKKLTLAIEGLTELLAAKLQTPAPAEQAPVQEMHTDKANLVPLPEPAAQPTITEALAVLEKVDYPELAGLFRRYMTEKGKPAGVALLAEENADKLNQIPEKRWQGLAEKIRGLL